jgi:hypothetical protein
VVNDVAIYRPVQPHRQKDHGITAGPSFADSRLRFLDELKAAGGL